MFPKVTIALPLLVACLPRGQGIQISQEEESVLIELCKPPIAESSSFRSSFSGLLSSYKKPSLEESLSKLEPSSEVISNSVFDLLPKVNLNDFDYGNFTKLSPGTCVRCNKKKSQVFYETCKRQMCQECGNQHYQDLDYDGSTDVIHRLPYDMELFSIDMSTEPHLAVLQKPSVPNAQEALDQFKLSASALGKELLACQGSVPTKVFDPVKKGFKLIVTALMRLQNMDLMKTQQPLFQLDKEINSIVENFRVMIQQATTFPTESSLHLGELVESAFNKGMDLLYFIKMFSVRVERAVLFKNIPDCHLQNEFTRKDIKKIKHLQGYNLL